MKFSELSLSENLLKAITELGYESATEIQAQAIPGLLTKNKDFVGQAQTGTGKTAAFAIPLLEKIDPNSKQIQALVLAPTRELAMQVDNEIQKLGKYTGIKSQCIYGGTSYDRQLRGLKQNRPQIIVGTPGRVIDLVDRGVLNFSSSKFCVLDEADEMLNMGFFEDVQKILEFFEGERQLIMFSATMPSQITNLIRRSFREYDLVKTENKILTNDNIEQKYFILKERYFIEALARLVESEVEEVYAMVFCRTKVETMLVGEKLQERGLKIEILNGNMGQNERERSMRNFKDKRANIMVCTDVAARGIDVTDLTHVYNLGLPQGTDSYVHRIGRTGRAGKTGKAYTLIGPRDSAGIKRIERYTKQNIELGKLPTVEQLKKKVVKKEVKNAEGMIAAIMDKGSEFKIDDSYAIFQDYFSDLKKEDILRLMFTWKFNKTFRQYNDLSDLDVKPVRSYGDLRSDNGRRRGGRPSGGGGARRGGARRASGGRGGYGGGGRSGERSERSSDRSGRSSFSGRSGGSSRSSDSRGNGGGRRKERS